MTRRVHFKGNGKIKQGTALCYNRDGSVSLPKISNNFDFAGTAAHSYEGGQEIEINLPGT